MPNTYQIQKKHLKDTEIESLEYSNENYKKKIAENNERIAELRTGEKK